MVISNCNVWKPNSTRIFMYINVSLSYLSFLLTKVLLGPSFNYFHHNTKGSDLSNYLIEQIRVHTVSPAIRGCVKVNSMYLPNIHTRLTFASQILPE